MTEKKSWRDFVLISCCPMAAVGLLAVGVGSLPWKLGPSWFGGDCKLEDRLKMLGASGDMFGFLNAVFSGVAFAAIYYTLRIQQKQHDIQMAELNMKRQVARVVVDENESRQVFRAIVPGKNSQECPASYVRLDLKNEASTPARGCRAVLTSIEKKGGGEQFSVIPESRITLRLLHFTERDNEPEDKVFTIPYGIPEYFHVCSIKQDPPGGDPFCLLQLAARGFQIQGGQ